MSPRPPTRASLERQPFFRVPRVTRATSAGPVELPILYFDVRNVVALFDAPLGPARDLLREVGLTPVTMAPGKAVVGLSFYDYLDTTVGPYQEVGTAIFAVREGEESGPVALFDLLRPPSARRLGMWVVDLPVSTTIANAAGRELWGYPKFVTRIPFRLEHARFDGAVLDPDGAGEICRLTGRLGAGVPAPPLSLMTYSRRDGALVRAHVDVRGLVRLGAGGALTLSVGASHHPMAERLRALGLDGAGPRVTLSTERFQSRLHEGRPA
jgi:hypothetical protein